MRPDYRPDDETRITSASGGQKGQKQARFGGGDPLAYMELARVYGFGEEKYDRYNYLKGYEFSLSIDALFRHLFAFIGGEDRDPESGLLHTAHVAWHGQTLSSFLLRGVGVDDRPPAIGEPEHVVKTYTNPLTLDNLDGTTSTTVTSWDEAGQASMDDLDTALNLLRDALTSHGLDFVVVDEEDDDIDRFFGQDRAVWDSHGNLDPEFDNNFVGTPIEQMDGCFLYRGIHVSPTVASPKVFREIDRMIKAREG
jgi:hypothetical protein